MFYASQKHEEEADLHGSGKDLSVYEKQRAINGYWQNI